MQIALPLDTEGYLRRKCYQCRRQFKLLDALTDAPQDWEDRDEHLCPYCGKRAPTRQRFTREQIAYMQKTVHGQVPEDPNDIDLDALLAGNEIITADPDGLEGLPAALQERLDMTRSESPCHPFLPFKVITLWRLQLHCPVCGEKFGEKPPEPETSLPF